MDRTERQQRAAAIVQVFVRPWCLPLDAVQVDFLAGWILDGPVGSPMPDGVPRLPIDTEEWELLRSAVLGSVDSAHPQETVDALVQTQIAALAARIDEMRAARARERRPVELLFVHGLESHPNGSKVRLLRDQGFEVTAPDMEMALWRLNRRNSALRNLLRSAEVWIVATLVAVGLGSAIVTPSVVQAIVAVIATGVWWATRRRALLAHALARSFDTSVEIQRQALRVRRPAVVVGSSWGGAVVAELVRRGDWDGPTVLLAPAIRSVGTWSGRDTGPTVAALRSAPLSIVVFHDPADHTVPHADSVALAGGSRIVLRSVDAGGHRLLGILKSGELADTLRRIAG